jgi:hypothetical protein
MPVRCSGERGLEHRVHTGGDRHRGRLNQVLAVVGVEDLPYPGLQELLAGEVDRELRDGVVQAEVVRIAGDQALSRGLEFLEP